MAIDKDKLKELARTLTDDQRRLLREGLAGGGVIDPKSLAKSLRSLDTKAVLARLAADSPFPKVPPLKFKKARRTSPASRSEPVIVKVDRASVTLADVRRLAKKRSGRDLTSMSEVRVLDLDPSEVTEPILRKLASHDLTGASATSRRFVRIERPSMSTSIGDLGQAQEGEGGAAVTARLVIVVIVFGPIIIIIIGNPPDPPPEEPPLTRW
jgi:hypothetical protein